MGLGILDKFIKWGTGAGDVNSQDIPAAFTPSNYTPVEVGSEGADKVSAHLKGIDNAVSGGGGGWGTSATYTPQVYTDGSFSLGDGSFVGRYWLDSELMRLQFQFKAGSTTAVSGTYISFGLPSAYKFDLSKTIFDTSDLALEYAVMENMGLSRIPGNPSYNAPIIGSFISETKFKLKMIGSADGFPEYTSFTLEYYYEVTPSIFASAGDGCLTHLTMVFPYTTV